VEKKAFLNPKKPSFRLADCSANRASPTYTMMFAFMIRWIPAFIQLFFCELTSRFRTFSFMCVDEIVIFRDLGTSLKIPLYITGHLK
jgi:hypothetical protein